MEFKQSKRLGNANTKQ